MNWLNIDIAVLRSTEFIGADPIARATWLCLMGYCADQENGGVIADCESWGDRRWMQTCAVTRAEIDSSRPLAFWDASALHVAFYPLHQESKVTTNRTNGLKGGRPKAKTELKPDGKPKENHVVQVGVNVKESNSKVIVKESKVKELILDGSGEPVLEKYDDSAFVEFWKVYPNKKSKEASFKAWRSLSKKGLLPANEEIIPLIELWAKSDEWLKDDGQWIPHASTWLNGKKWQDGIPKARTQSSTNKPAHQQTATFHSTGDEYLKSKGLI